MIYRTLTLLTWLCLAIADFAYAQSFKELSDAVLKTTDHHTRWEAAMNINFHRNDSDLHSSQLATLKHWNTIDDKDLECAKNLLLADLYSVIADSINRESNDCFDKAESYAKDTKNQGVLAIINIRRGNYYFTYRKNRNALRYFTQASQILEDIDLKTLPLPAKHLQYMSSFYAYIGDYSKARYFLQEVAPLVEKNTRSQINNLNSIGVYYSRDTLMAQAKKYYLKAMHIANSIKDTVWIGILNGNLGDIEFSKGDTATGLRMSEYNIATSLKYGEKNDAMRAAIIISEIYFKRKDWANCRRTLQIAEKIFEDKPFFLEYRTQALKINAQLALYAQKDYSSAAKYFEEYLTFNDSLQKQRDYENLHKIVWELETKQFESEVQQKMLENRENKIRFFAALLITICLTGISILFVNRSRQKIKLKAALLEKEQLSLRLENQKIDEELQRAKLSMTTFLSSLQKNDDIIASLESKLAEAESRQQNNLGEINNELNQMLASHIMTDERWHKFKNLFEIIHPSFTENCLQQYKDLNEGNVRLLTLMELGLNNKSIANLLGISVDGVKKAKQRLRKKAI